MHPVLQLAVPGTDRRMPLEENSRLSVGRAPDCDICLDDQAVSRHHCTLEVRDGGVIVTDLESANGTFLNARLIRTASARAGDTIRVGSTALELWGAGGPRPPAALSDGDEGTMDSVIRRRFEPERLSAEEFAEMKQHPVHGARILANIQSLSVSAVLPGVHYHHERWDGGGYPEGLSGESIPILGRLLAAADFLDALTSARSYRQACPVEEALGLMERGAGTHFDPAIVEAVVRLHRRGELLPLNWERADGGGARRARVVGRRRPLTQRATRCRPLWR